MAIYTTPTNVSNGTVLTNAYLETLFGNNGTLNYLNDGLNTYGSNCDPVFVQATTANVAVATNTTTNAVFTIFQYGQRWWDGTKISTASCSTPSLTGRKFLVYFNVFWQTASTIGFRRQIITVANTNSNTDYTEYVASRTPPSTSNVNTSQTILIPFDDIADPSTFSLTFRVWQNAGISLTYSAQLRIIQLPNV
jgi:hypothetical protein